MNKRVLSTSLFLAVVGLTSVSAQTVTFIENSNVPTNTDQQYCGEPVDIKFSDGKVIVTPTAGKGEAKTYEIGDGKLNIQCDPGKVEVVQLFLPAGSSNGMASYVSTDALDLTKAIGSVYGYVATAASKSNITMRQQMQFKAGEGMILLGTPGWHCLPVATGSITPAASNIFLGSPTEGHYVTSSEKTYALSKTYGTMNPVTPGLTIPAKKAYLTLASSGNATPMSLSLSFDEDDATSISNVAPVSVDAEGATYNVAGQRTNGGQGIVIKNGVKVVK